jgi:hypothetical protein
MTWGWKGRDASRAPSWNYSGIQFVLSTGKLCTEGGGVASTASQTDRAHKQNVSHVTDCGHELKKPRAASTRQPS